MIYRFGPQAVVDGMIEEQTFNPSFVDSPKMAKTKIPTPTPQHPP